MVDYATSLFTDAKAYAKSRGFKLGRGAEDQFKYFAREAANDLAKESAERREARARLAASNFEVVIDQMILERAAFKDYPPGEIGEVTLDAARKKLCPIWPVCKK